MAKKDLAKKEPVIPKREWGMPVSFDDAGRPVSLKDYISGDGKARDFSTLDDDQQIDLAVKRIEMQEEYLVRSFGSGTIDGARAIKEVSSRTALGRRLGQIEMRVVTSLLEVAKKRTPP